MLRVARPKIPRQVIALKVVSPAAMLDEELRELLDNAVVGLELRHLQRGRVAVGIAHAHEHDVGIADGLEVKNRVEQNAQALPGDDVGQHPHAAGDIQGDNDRR